MIVTYTGLINSIGNFLRNFKCYLKESITYDNMVRSSFFTVCFNSWRQL
jgi:hypothetical protein